MDRTPQPISPDERLHPVTAADAFDVDRFTELRHAQQYYLDTNLSVSEDEKEATLRTMIDDYMASFLPETSSDDTRLYRDMFTMMSVIYIPQQDWELPVVDQETGQLLNKTPRQIFHESAAAQFPAIYGSDPSHDSGLDDHSTRHEQEPTEKACALEDVRTRYAKATAKRQGRLWGEGRKYLDLENEYRQAVITHGKEVLETDIDPDGAMKADEKNAAVVAYLLGEEQNLRGQVTDNLKNTKVGKFVEWMNRGSKATRFAKGLAIGAAGGVAIAAGGAIFGAVGAGTGVVAAGGALARGGVSFARGFAKKDAESRTMADVAQTNDELLEGGNEHEIWEHVTTKLTIDRDEATRQQQSERRRSVTTGLGGAAVGLVLGGTVAYAVGHFVPDGAMGGIHNRILSDGGSAGSDATHVTNPTPIPHQSPVNSPGAAPYGPSIDPNTLGNSMLTEPKVHHIMNVDQLTDALRIDPGEGWYQTFSECGISDPLTQQQLLQDSQLMEGLVKMGYAYQDTSIGGYGIRMTPDGRMPREVIQAVRGVAMQRYGAFLSL